jgi:hypothetical protein
MSSKVNDAPCLVRGTRSNRSFVACILASIIKRASKLPVVVLLEMKDLGYRNLLASWPQKDQHRVDCGVELIWLAMMIELFPQQAECSVGCTSIVVRADEIASILPLGLGYMA